MAETELAASHTVLVASRLRQLIDRKVPARAVEAVPGVHSARVRFADGTALLVRGEVPGGVAILASRISKGPVPVAASLQADGTHLAFQARAARSRVSVLVVGLDQQD